VFLSSLFALAKLQKNPYASGNIFFLSLFIAFALSFGDSKLSIFIAEFFAD